MKTAHIVIDLGFGDCGKGTTVSKLVEETGSPLVVRFNGGAQAAHNVQVNGVHHTFNQFGSGTLQGASTFLSEKHIFNPVALYTEARELSKKMGITVESLLKRVYIHSNCLVTTTAHIFLNRINNLRTAGTTGTCGMGIAATIQNPILVVRDLKSNLYSKQLEYFFEKVRNDLGQVTDSRIIELANELDLDLNPDHRCDEVRHSVEIIDRVMAHVQVVDDYGIIGKYLSQNDVIFEGAQGVLLDEAYGVGPNTTWSDCTSRNAKNILNYLETPHKSVVWGCLKPFTTRHGAGPLPSYKPKMDPADYDLYNVRNLYQGDFRIGSFDLELHEYAIRVSGGVDVLALHGLDLQDTFKIAHRGLSKNVGMAKLLNISPTLSRFVSSDNFVAELQKIYKIPVGIVGYGVYLSDKKLLIDLNTDLNI